MTGEVMVRERAMRSVTIREDVLRVLREAEAPLGKREICARMTREVKRGVLSSMLSTLVYDGLVTSAKSLGAPSLFRYVGFDGGPGLRLQRAMAGWVREAVR